ncbi:hypothetical protein BX286_2541 [Streptomyces sp. 3211.6]|uniref:hypothetical protein n=1 Tax=Streptomyces TaxID=1883 RepID=UPI0009A4C1F3|nr:MULTISPECIES: hypothetical protein [Streptomyces]RKT04581.1 hypothetical protein BX286_2541 [Streptomyces sp. 3211.6]RPF40456.1 hypothetical protein EDD96_4217 [Streptomyces sp. Ag109_G2-6]
MSRTARLVTTAALTALLSAAVTTTATATEQGPGVISWDSVRASAPATAKVISWDSAPLDKKVISWD